jgi:transcriptional regulator with GAF, ATPase, and Fis domain
MNPRLFALSGPLKGSTIALSEEETSFGRESSNRVVIVDASLSRRHCLLVRKGETFSLRDLESLNGTYVNGAPIKEQTLNQGDRVRLGDSVFAFLTGDDDAPLPSSSVRFSEEHLGAHTQKLRREDARYLDDERVQAALPKESRASHDLSALLKVSAAIHASRSLAKLQQHLFEMMADFIPVERGAILWAEGDDFTPVFGWDLKAGASGEVIVSRTIARRALVEDAAILSNDVGRDRGSSGMTSLSSAAVHSFLAVPVTTVEKRIGVMWLANRSPFVTFDEDHLQLAVAIAGIAAPALDNLRHLEWLENENARLASDSRRGHDLIGDSPRLQEVLQRIIRVAPTDSTVLIRGESGTGKELVARAIQRKSRRAEKPFVAINCAALPETLLESELFGHEKGAFTGAIAQKKGRIETAEGGTLFLDEIGEMAPTIQAKVLRVLQERQFERVGGTRTINADIRLVAATNRDLEAEVKAGGTGTFRADLYYRLNVVTINVPPLRERREDIELLTDHFVAKHGEKCNRRLRGVSQSARAVLNRYDWPGNVRELENAIERAVVLGTDELIQLEDLPENILETGIELRQLGDSTSSAYYHEAVKATKREIIQRAVEQANGNLTEAAGLLGVHPNYLHRLINNLDLRSVLKK